MSSVTWARASVANAAALAIGTDRGRSFALSAGHRAGGRAGQVEDRNLARLDPGLSRETHAFVKQLLSKLTLDKMERALRMFCGIGIRLTTLPVAVALAASSAIAQTSALPTARQREIIRLVQSSEGYLTPALHDEFWDEVPVNLRRNIKFVTQLRSLMNRVIDPAADYMAEVWESAQLSLEAGRVVRSQNYAIAQDAALAASQNAAYREKLRQSFANGERILEAAANKTPLELHGGSRFVTPDLIAEVLSGASASKFRARALMDPAWRGAPQYFRYPKAHVSVLSPTPFKEQTLNVEAADGRKVQLVRLTRPISKEQYTGIAYLAGDVGVDSLRSAVISIAKGALARAGLIGSDPIVSSWQNRVSASAIGTAKTSAGFAAMSVRVVEIRELGGFVTFMAVSTLSSADAQYELAKLEDSVQIAP